MNKQNVLEEIRRLDRRLDRREIRVPECLMHVQALQLTGRTCDELFAGWTGGARVPTSAELERAGLPGEVADLAVVWEQELARQADLGRLVEDGAVPDDDGEGSGDRVYHAPLAGVIPGIVATRIPREVLEAARSQTAGRPERSTRNWGRDAACGCVTGG